MLNIQGRGFPISSFQQLAVKLSGNQSLDCQIQAASATNIQCLISRSVPPLIRSSDPQGFDLQLTSNSEPAVCSVPTGCRITLQPSTVLNVSAAEPAVLGYTGNLIVDFEEPARLVGEALALSAPRKCP